jgi:hypothetical protein
MMLVAEGSKLTLLKIAAAVSRINEQFVMPFSSALPIAHSTAAGDTCCAHQTSV